MDERTSGDEAAGSRETSEATEGRLPRKAKALGTAPAEGDVAEGGAAEGGAAEGDAAEGTAIGGAAVEGKVIDTAGGELTGADVWLFREGGRTGRTTTQGDGSFRISLGDGDERWPAGEYVLRVLPRGCALTTERTVEVPAEGSPAPRVVEARSRRDVSPAAGWGFLLVLCAVLVAACWGYLAIHGVTLEKLRDRETIGARRTGAIDAPLADALRLTRRQVEAAGAVDGGGGDALQASGAPESLATAESIFQELETSRAGLLEERKLVLLRGLFAQAKTALAAGDGEGLAAALAELSAQVEDTESSFLWEENPGRLLEVMFWALLATLLRLIFNAGQYLYRGTFYRAAVPQHLAFLFTVPAVAVVIALVLTVVRIDASGETGVLLDMGNVLVAIILGALIGLAPWRAWEFLRALADRVFEGLAGWVGGDRETGGSAS